jgi:DNA-binding transcriptional ArsR family regulator
MDTKYAVPRLASLAQENRLAVFRRLVEAGPEGATPGELAEQLDVPAATLSFHLKTLQHAGMIGAQRSGRFIRYTADFDAVRGLVDFLMQNCCGGDMSKCAPAAACAPPKRRARAG